MIEAADQKDLQHEIESLKERLDQASAELQDFLYIVSHDFRGPLRAIMSASMILIEDYSDVLDADARAELKRQSDAAKKLNRLLEELLKLSRLNRQELRPENLNLGDLARRTVESRGLESSTLEVHGELKAAMDKDLAEKLVECLVDNSIKFAQPNVKLKLEFGVDKDGYYFKDNGIGLEPERADRVFLPFERLNGDDYPGLGVGLSTVKRIVNRHLGVVSALGTPNEGVTIRFTLPP